MGKNIERPTGSLVGPYDTSKEEAGGHIGGRSTEGKPEGGTLAGPYETSKEEADGHGDGRNAKGNMGKHGRAFMS